MRNLTLKVHEIRQRLVAAKALDIDCSLDLETLIAALDQWPTAGWERQQIMDHYRLRMLRGLSAAAFIRTTRLDNA